MYNFMKKTKGAISIFLVLVMLPMLMISSIFVDVGRINLAKSMAASAGDLTLNTAMTNYDSVLKNMYGLFATSQNMDELMANLEVYYTSAIEAAGVDEADADDYVDQIMGYLRTETGTADLMNIDVTSFEVSVPTGATLANPAVLKSQIVEFMKYRAPLNLGMGFLDALTSLKDLDKQTQLVEDKTAFYSKQEGIIKNLETAWREMQLYQECYVESHSFPTVTAGGKTYITTQGEKLKGELQDRFESIIWDTVAFLYYYDYFYSPDTGCIAYEDNDTPDDTSDDYWKIDNKKVTPAFREDKQATAEEVKSRLQTALDKIEAVKTKMSLDIYKDYITNTTDEMSKTTSSKFRAVFAVTQFNKENFLGPVKELTEALIHLQSAVENCSETEKLTAKSYKIQDGKVVSDGTATLKNLAETQVRNHLVDPSSWTRESNSYVSEIMYWAGKVQGWYNNTKSQVNGKKDSIADKDSPFSLHYIVNQINEFDDMIEARMKNLETAVTNLQSAHEQISNPKSEYNLALKEWEKSAGNLAGQTVGDNDVAEIAKIRDNIKAEDLQKLIDNLNKKKATLQKVRDKIATYKLNSTAWMSIQKPGDGYKAVIAMLTAQQKEMIEDVVPTSHSDDGDTNPNNDYSSAATSIISSLKGEQITAFWTESADKEADDPDLRKPTLKLYTYLYNNYYITGLKAESAKGTSKVDSAKNELNSSKTELESAADTKEGEADAPGTDVSVDLSDYFKMEEGEEGLPSQEWDEVLETIKNGAIETNQDTLLASPNDTGSVLGDLLTAIANGVSGLRDDLYVSEYIMKMFTYETFEAEIAREVLNKDKPAAWYTKGEDGTFTIKDEYKKCVDEALTLTNVPLNPNSNFLYGSEVEYIIYGSTGGLIDHSTKVKGTIFLLRFALNTAYAFTDAEINSTTTAAATAIFGTPPLTPLIPVAKVAMTIGLAIAETAWDLGELNNGKAVPLMKNSTTWVMKSSSAAKKVAVEVANAAIEKVAEVGYNLLNDALEMTDEELTAMIGGATESLENLANAVADSTIDKLVNCGCEAVQQVATLCNQLNEELTFNESYNKATDAGSTPAKVTTVTARLKEWLTAEEATSSKYEYEAKKIAVDYLTTGNNISDIFTAIQQAPQGVLDPKTGSNVLEAKLREISSLVEGKIKDLSERAETELGKLKKQLLDEVKTAATKGVEELRKTLKSKVSNMLGTNGSGTVAGNHVVANLLNWKYSDYLRLFLLVALIADDEAVMLRTADVIELNMQHEDKIYGVVETTKTKTVSRLFGLIKYDKEVSVLTGNDEAFKMSKAYTYLSISADMEVKPLLMKLPFMDDVTDRALNGTTWYQIHYEGTLGY